MPASDLIRTWCLDLQWFSNEDAEKAVVALCEAGWLETGKDGLLPISDGLETTAPLGWWPKIQHLQHPPKFIVKQKAQTVETMQSSVAFELAPSVEKTITPVPVIDDDPRMRLVPRLVKYVARKAGLENEEVERRMLRKQRALGPITPWMCLILIAREQGLPTDDITEMFAS